MKKIKKLVRPRWTKEEVVGLKNLYRNHSNAEISKLIGRKESSIIFKAHLLGLSKSANRLRAMGQENVAQRWGKRGKTARKRN
jgi:hypothetical protein